jgi:chromosome segregation ATPase
MTARGTTQRRAYDAACAIAARGETPTVAAIKRELGGKGGQLALQEGFKDWLAAAARRFRAPELPAPLQQPVLSLWDTATRLAAEQWDEARTALGGRVEALEARVVELERSLSDRDAQIAAAQERAQIAEQSLIDAQDARDLAAAEVVRLREELDEKVSSLARECAAREEQQAQRQRVEAVLAEARSSLAHAQEQLAGVRRELDVAAARNELLSTSEADAKKALARSLEDIESARRDVEQLREIVSQRDSQITALTATVQAEQQARDADTEHWTGLVEDVRAQLRETKERERALSAEKQALVTDVRRKEAIIARIERAANAQSSAVPSAHLSAKPKGIGEGE